MSNDEAILAKKVARLLRAIAKKIENNPEILNDLNLEISEIPTTKKKKIYEHVEIDIFSIYSVNGEKALRNELEKLSMSQLKTIIRQNGFDPTKLSDKWRNKKRLIELIVDRVKSRSTKGQVFRDYK